jgi:pyrimidine operon attenuation protein/uracil phosphoribosyltransferase
MKSKIILGTQQFGITINRLCYQLIENHNDFKNSAIIGLQPRGIFLAGRICATLKKLIPAADIKSGNLDITFFRDDFKRRDNPIIPSTTAIDFIIENKNVILVDDVLYTGRTIRAGLDALLAFGRPERVELLTLIDRKFSRHLPIQPNYTGIAIDTISSDKVLVKWKESDGEDVVTLITKEKE